MVKIPLLRRQPKPDPSQAEDGRGKEAKGKEASRVENEAPAPPAAAEDRRPPVAPQATEKNIAEPASSDGKGKRIPFPLKPREQREQPASPVTAHPEPASIPVSPPDKRQEDRPVVTAAPERAPSTAPPPDSGLQPSQFVIGTDKKIPVPKKPPAYDIGKPKADTVEAGEKPSPPKAAIKVQEISPAPPDTAGLKTAVAEKTRVEKAPAVIEKPEDKKPEAAVESAAVVKEAPALVPAAAAAAERTDEKKPEAVVDSVPAVVESAPAVGEASAPVPAAPATAPAAEKTEDKGHGAPVDSAPAAEAKLALPRSVPSDKIGDNVQTMVTAMPDLLFRIGPNGIRPALGDGSKPEAAAAPTASHGPGDENGKRQPLGPAVLENLTRLHEPYTRKVLETLKPQAFEFQVRGENESHDMEARLVPLDRGEVLALVRDVTDKVQSYHALIESRNELENHLKERNAELMRVNKMLKGEVELRGEQEEILKKNFRRLERLLEDTIGAITMIVEERDPHIANHQRRVSQLACAIGQEMKLRNDQMRAVRMAAQLHDLGKIFIPAEILRKPSKLTPAEISVVRTHPDTDYRILKRIDFPISIADVVRQHHERMDGSGYPQGLKGESILLEARILAVADVIEGMVFERPYRVAPGLEAALKEIGDNKGTLYDAAVAEACLKLFAEEHFKFEQQPAGVNAGEVTLGSDQRDL